jgi:hypothetical protein
MAAIKTKGSGKSKWLIYGVLLLILLVAGYQLYSHVSIAANKRSFQDARTTIDSIYYDVAKQIGPADNAQVSSSCKRDHVEFGAGQLSCNVGINFVYGVDSESEASVRMSEVQKLIKKSKLKPTKPLSAGLKDSDVATSTFHTASDSYRLGSLDCVATYVYDTPEAISLSIKNQGQKTFEISLGCYGPAKQQYYRLAS